MEENIWCDYVSEESFENTHALDIWIKCLFLNQGCQERKNKSRFFEFRYRATKHILDSKNLLLDQNVGTAANNQWLLMSFWRVMIF